MKVLISGAGVGGLATALCCLSRGLEVKVFEQAAKLSEIGAGIQLPPNAMKVFQALELEDSISQNACQPESLEARMGKNGSQLFTIPLTDRNLSKWGAPYLHIHRADYVDALRTALIEKSPESLELNASVQGYQQDSSSVTLVLQDGRRVKGDVLIGADGIHSPTRAEMLGPEQPRFTGNVAWRSLVPIDRLGQNAPPPTACVWMGPQRHCVTYRLRQGKLANFVGVVERADWRFESWHKEGDKTEALNDLKGWHPTIIQTIEESEAIFCQALFDRPAIKHWVQGRVALLGDAAHPMLPFMAQGAAMAVEDAWIVSTALFKAAKNIPKALKAYEQTRRQRAIEVATASRANAKTFHQDKLFGQIKTYGPMWLAGKLTPWVVHRRNDWLYGYDVTQIDPA